jgi:alpha-1,2-mannosyltransferase
VPHALQLPRSARQAARGVVLLLAAAALATAVGLYVAHGSFVLDRIASDDELMHTDFQTFWRSAVAFLDGQDIYRTDAAVENLNPPFLTLLMAPLGLLGFWPAYRLFVVVGVVLVVGSMALVAAELRVRPAAATVVTVAVLLSSPVLATLGLGQMYALLTAGLAAAFVLGRRGRTVLEGVALGVTVALKPSLAPVLLVPLVRRRWGTLAAGIAAGGVATVAGWAAAGVQSLPNWVVAMLTHSVQAYFDNASLPGTLLRLTSESGNGSPVADVPGGATIGLVAGLALIGLTAWLARRPPATGPDSATWAMAGAALLASPLSWHNYLMVLMPGVLVLVVRGRWPVAALLLALALIGMEWPPSCYGPDGTASAVPLSLYCAILVLYWAALLQRPASAAPPPAPSVDPAPAEVVIRSGT